MRKFPTRREILLGTAAAVAASSALPFPSTIAHAAESITAVEWGGPWVEIMKELAAKQDLVDISWELHEGGSSAILAKVKASWPHPRYDLISSWDPVYASFAREQWYEPLTVESVPVLAQMPPQYLRKDEAGKIVNVPRSIGGFFLAYRKDKVPFEILKL